VTRRARETVWAFIGVLVLVVAGLALDRRIHGPAAAPPATAHRTSGVQRTSGIPAQAQRLTVAYARDGDTLEASATTAGRPVPTTERITVRLLGIDAPETHGATGQPQCYARDAYRELQKLTPNGSTVFVLADQQLFDRYQRYLLYVWNSEGIFVNAELARLGYARALAIKPNTARQNVIDTAVSEATNARRGLWGTCVTATG
jgi:micrococcal nuclease